MASGGRGKKVFIAHQLPPEFTEVSETVEVFLHA